MAHWVRFNVISCNALYTDLSVALIKHISCSHSIVSSHCKKCGFLSCATFDLLLVVCPRFPIIAPTCPLPREAGALPPNLQSTERIPIPEPLSWCFLVFLQKLHLFVLPPPQMQKFILCFFQHPRCSVMFLITFFISQVNSNYLNKYKRKKNIDCLKPRHQRASLVAQMVKNLPAMQETWVWFLDQEDSLEKGMATHSSILA